MYKLESEQELKEVLQNYVLNSNKKSVKILAGHLPLLYNTKGGNSLELGVNRWGIFSEYTFKLGVDLFVTATNNGKESGLIVLVDDLVEIPLINKNEKLVRNDKSWMKLKRRRFYSDAHLPSEYINMLSRYGLSENVVLEQKRNDGSNSKLISEKMTKATAISKGLIAPNECAQSYKGLLYDAHFFDADKDVMISFVPGQCKGNVCSGLLDTQKDIDSLHVFFPHMEDLGGLMSIKEGYVKDSRKPMTVEEMFQAGVYYRIDKAEK
jgi:hypothetical protein